MKYKTIKVQSALHSALKQMAAEKGMKLEFLTAQLIEGVLNKKPPVKKPKAVQILLKNSEYANVQDFIAVFVTMEWAAKLCPIDPHKLWQNMYAWSESKHKKSANWMQTAFQFASRSPEQFRPEGYLESPKDKKWRNFYNSLVNTEL
jgi:hypothetical protein